jgi:hypothetical protein
MWYKWTIYEENLCNDAPNPCNSAVWEAIWEIFLWHRWIRCEVARREIVWLLSRSEQKLGRKNRVPRGISLENSSKTTLSNKTRFGPKTETEILTELIDVKVTFPWICHWVINEWKVPEQRRYQMKLGFSDVLLRVDSRSTFLFIRKESSSKLAME